MLIKNIQAIVGKSDNGSSFDVTTKRKINYGKDYSNN